MTDIVTIKKNDVEVYPRTHRTAVIGLESEPPKVTIRQINNGVDGINYEVDLNLTNEGIVGQQLNKQFLFNAKFTYGSTVLYSAHLTGVLSFDGYWKTDKVVFGLNVTILSERNTGGNINGNTGNEPIFDYYFKETGTKEILPSADVATVVFKFPYGVYNASTDYNSFGFKGLQNLLKDGAIYE